MVQTDPELTSYLEAVPPTRRQDAETLIDLMIRVTAQPPVIGGGAVGFGSYHYRYASGQEGDAPAAGFAIGKATITIYFMDGVGPYRDRLRMLGPHRAAVGCIYLKRLADINLEILESMVAESYKTLTSGTYRHRARDSQGGRPEPVTDS